MPNGYTASIYEGKAVTLRDFILDCARGFGFAIMQRDDPSDAPLITHYEPRTDYYDETIAKARARLAELHRMTEADAERAAQEEYEQAAHRWEESITESAARAQRYDEMIAKTEAWKVPAELMDMRQTILGWLRESRESDCRPLLERPRPKDGPSWRAEATEKAERDLRYGLEHRAAEVERTNERNRHLDLLMASLGD